MAKSKNIIIEWLVWQFYEMPKFLLEVWNNYFVFATNFFSVPLLLKTLFSPWHRYSWKYPSIVNVEEFFSTLISNFFSRILGAMVRIVLIIAGIIFQIFIALAGILVLAGWFAIPLAALLLLAMASAF